jgi:hypothetical protein
MTIKRTIKINKKIKMRRMIHHLVAKRPNPNERGAKRPRNAKDSLASKSTF